MMGGWLVGQWIVGVISFQKIFGLCGLNGHIDSGEKVGCHTDVDGRTECEDRARILETKFAKTGNRKQKSDITKTGINL